MNLRNTIRKISIILLSAGALVYMNSCDSFKQTTTDISGIDLVACQQLNDSMFYNINTQTLTDFDSTWTDSVAMLNVGTVLDSLKAHQIVVEAGMDTAYMVRAAEAINYVNLQTDFSDIVIFINQIVRIELYDAAGTLVSKSDATMPLETISGCQKEDADGVSHPTVKVRESFNLPGNQYLLRIIKTDKTTSSVLGVTIQKGN